MAHLLRAESFVKIKYQLEICLLSALNCVVTGKAMKQFLNKRSRIR